MRKILQTIGIVMFALGVSTADSELLFIPLSLVVMGMLMLYLSEKER